MTKPFIVYLDCLVTADMHFNRYVDHRQTRPFHKIVLYSGWLAYGSRLTAPYLPEHVMRLFGYMHTTPRHPVVTSPPALTHRQIDDIFAYFKSHLIPGEAQSMIA